MKNPTAYIVKPKRLTVDWTNVLKEESGKAFNKKWLRPSVSKQEVPLEKNLKFCTGSSYKGQTNSIDMNGHGVYTFPHGVVYEGEMKDGMFHGNGTLTYPNGQILDGVFREGKIQTWKYKFSKDSEVNPKTYCKYPDRRFCHSINYGLQGAPHENLTEEQPTRQIPDGCYDVVDGFYNTKTKWVQNKSNPNVHLYCPPTTSANPDSKTFPLTPKEFVTKIPNVPVYKTADWIEKNCRVWKKDAVGYKPELYECWYNGKKNEKMYLPPGSGWVKDPLSSKFINFFAHSYKNEY